MFYLGMLALGVCLALPIAAIGVGLGQGKAAAAALEGIARQPEALNKIQPAMILALAFMEAIALFAFIIFLLMFGKLPGLTTEQVMEIAKTASGG